MFLEAHLLQLSLSRPCHHHPGPHRHPSLHLTPELQVPHSFHSTHKDNGCQGKSAVFPNTSCGGLKGHTKEKNW